MLENTFRNQLFKALFLSVILVVSIGCKPNIEKLSDTGNVDKLINALEHNDWKIRRDAAVALGDLKDPLSIEPLINSLFDENNDVQISARGALIEIGEPAVSPLLEAAGDDYFANQPIFYLLADIGSEQAVYYFISALGDKTSRIRNVAGDALIKIGSPAVEPLISVLEDDNLADQAIAVLDQMDWAPKVDINHFWYWVRTDQFNKIIEIGSDAIPQLNDLLGNESRKIRMKAAQALVEMGDPQVVDTLIAWLNESEEVVQIFAARLLGEFEDSQAIEPLLTLLEDENIGFELYRAAFTSLSELGKPLLSDLDPILTALTPICSEPDEWSGIISLDPPIPAEFYPLVVLDEDDQVTGWTSLFLWKWEPNYSSDDLLIACMDQRYQPVKTCMYMGAGTIERRKNRLEIKIRKADSGVEIASMIFRGEEPPECPLTRDLHAPSKTYYGEIQINEVETWFEEYVP